MPLSENEQKLLEQMERALYADDPKFASSLRGSDPRRRTRRRTALAAVGFAVGIAVMIVGFVLPLTPLVVVGFLVMLVCLVLGITSHRAGAGTPDLRVVGGAARPGGTARAKRSGSFMQRLEARWDRRRDERP